MGFNIRELFKVPFQINLNISLISGNSKHRDLYEVIHSNMKILYFISLLCEEKPHDNKLAVNIGTLEDFCRFCIT